MPAPVGHAPYPGCETGGIKPKYDDEFYEREAEELLQWSQLYSSFRLYGFTNTKDYCVDDLQYFASRNDKFSRALRKAKERLALRREEGASDGVLPVAIHTKTSHIYDHELVSADDRQEDKKLEREIKLREAVAAKDLLNRDPAINQKYDDLMNQISNLRNDK